MHYVPILTPSGTKNLLPKNSIKRQLIIAVVVSQLLLAIGLTAAIVLYSRSQLLAAFDIMLEGRADEILAVIHDTEDETGTLMLDRERLSVPSDDFFEVWDEYNKLISSSKNWQGAPPSVLVSGSPIFQVANQQSSYRGIIVRKMTIFDQEDEHPGPLKKVTIVYASSTRDLTHRIFQIGFFAVASSLLLFLFAGLFAAHEVSRGLYPMQALAAEAKRVSARNWNFNPPATARKMRELAPLVDALDSTLASLKRAFNREQQFIADAAHELKTAVAILKSTLQLLVCRPRTSVEYKEGLERSLGDCGRLEALVCGILNLARVEQRTDHHNSDELQEIDLVESCEHSVAELNPVAQARDIRLRCTFKSNISVKADPADLQTVWFNLLQNAIQHSPLGSTVWMEVTNSPRGTALVVVEDAGAGIGPDQLPHVFERFRRGDPSRARATGGFGLGLSICKALIEGYGGDIQISNRNGTGTRVTVSLPGTSPTPISNARSAS